MGNGFRHQMPLFFLSVLIVLIADKQQEKGNIVDKNFYLKKKSNNCIAVMLLFFSVGSWLASDFSCSPDL